MAQFTDNCQSGLLKLGEARADLDKAASCVRITHCLYLPKSLSLMTLRAKIYQKVGRYLANRLGCNATYMFRVRIKEDVRFVISVVTLNS